MKINAMDGEEIFPERLTRLKSGLQPVDLSRSETTEDVDCYLKFYSLDFDDRKHFIGRVSSGSSELAVQVFDPGESKGTVILSHGYYDHSGVLKHLIRYLVESGYGVVTLDHVGHGLSTGRAAAIDNFDEYTQGLDSVLRFCRGELDGPFHLVGHSMGCSVILDLLRSGLDSSVDKVAMLAPLVRPAGWKASEWGMRFLGDTLDSVPRRFLRNSSDPEFLDFHRKDPLQARTVPMSWVKAHHRWYERIHTVESFDRNLLIVQGDRDGTVDWKYNLNFLEKTVPEPDIVMIPGGRHQLINESLEMRLTVFESVLDWIE